MTFTKNAPSNISISPDGNWLAYQDLLTGGINIFQIGKQHESLQSIPLEIPKDFVIYEITWCYSNKHLLVLAEKPDTRQLHYITASSIYIINREDQSISQPEQIKSARHARLVKLNAKNPNEIMFCANFFDELDFKLKTSLYRYDLEKQDIIIDAISFPKYIDNFVVDDEFKIHYYYAYNRGIENFYELTLNIFANTTVDQEPDQCEPTFEAIFSATSAYSIGKVKIAGFTADYSGIYILDPRGPGNYNSLKLLNTKTTDYTTIHSLPNTNISNVLFSNLYEATGKIIGYTSNAEMPKIYLTEIGKQLYPALSSLVEQLKQTTIAINRPRSFSGLVNRTLTHFILPNITEKDTYSIVKLEDRQSLKTIPLDTFKINELYAGNTEMAIVAARDDLPLTCYLVTPIKHTQQPMPCVVLVHGGPSARDKWAYRADAQFLADRGIATLLVNFRGSTNLGKKHFYSGHGQWAAGILNDIEDATNHFIKQGKIDETRLVIAGFSFGGYATLAMLTMRPGLFKAGIAGAGLTDLNLDLKRKESSPCQQHLKIDPPQQLKTDPP